MNKTDFFLGFAIGIIATILGCFLFIKFVTNFDFLQGVQVIKLEGKLGKLLTLGAILDLILFGVLLKLNKEMMARGVVLAVIVVAISTLFA